jgi:hypothetical protein
MIRRGVDSEDEVMRYNPVICVLLSMWNSKPQRLGLPVETLGSVNHE